jgi:hypothetical protein
MGLACPSSQLAVSLVHSSEDVDTSGARMVMTSWHLHDHRAQSVEMLGLFATLFVFPDPVSRTRNGCANHGKGAFA